MTKSSCPPLPQATRRGLFLLVLLATAAASAASARFPAAAGAQERPDPATLARQAQERFELLPTLNGILLRPRTAGPIQAVEIVSGAIAVNGQAVTGAELRQRLGADADLVLQLSYLDDSQRRTLFSSPASAPGPAPDAGVPVGAPAAPAPPPAPVAAPPSPPTAPAPADPPRQRGRRGVRDAGDRVRFGGSVTVDEDEIVAGDVVVIGGAARVLGEVTGDVVVVGGALHLGPNARIGKDAVVVGGALRREPGAQVAGELQEVAVGPLNINWRGPRGPFTDWWGGGAFGPAFSLFATVVRVAVFCLLAALGVLFARPYLERVTTRAVAEPVKAGAIGLLAQVLFVPVLVVTIVVCAVTIIGIPLLLLLPFALVALLILALAGFTAIATHVGRLIAERFNLTHYGPIATTVLGVVTIASPMILGRIVGLAGGPLWFLSITLLAIGFVVEYLTWTVGIGAVALLRFSRGFNDGGAVTGPVGPASGGPLGPPATDSISPA